MPNVKEPAETNTAKALLIVARKSRQTDRVSSLVPLKSMDESTRQIQRYIRLTKLTPELLQMVDHKKIAFNSEVEMSYFTKEQQSKLYETMQSEDRTPSLSQAIRLKQLAQEGKLDMNGISAIIREEKLN